ncbi:hypothetical protein GGX14DRAFT_393574 [Mycena pura]|uniref:Uncharacterized protein n=1 Tax=Mycena pura TaxID=153505 RepID=A0AAD6VIS0_9AGAR|nr:hypothetical protein GGX14DRAFT_393574 [Mycena pura]
MTRHDKATTSPRPEAEYRHEPIDPARLAPGWPGRESRDFRPKLHATHPRSSSRPSARLFKPTRWLQPTTPTKSSCNDDQQGMHPCAVAGDSSTTTPQDRGRQHACVHLSADYATLPDSEPTAHPERRRLRSLLPLLLLHCLSSINTSANKSTHLPWLHFKYQGICGHETDLHSAYKLQPISRSPRAYGIQSAHGYLASSVLVLHKGICTRVQVNYKRTNIDPILLQKEEQIALAIMYTWTRIDTHQANKWTKNTSMVNPPYSLRHCIPGREEFNPVRLWWSIGDS